MMPCAPRRWASRSAACLSALVGVDIEGEIDGALAITQLVELGVIQMGAQRASRVLKTGLP